MAGFVVEGDRTCAMGMPAVGRGDQRQARMSIAVKTGRNGGDSAESRTGGIATLRALSGIQTLA